MNQNNPYSSPGEILNLINLIRPWHMADQSKIRIGSDADGGYVLPASARQSSLVFSIGIGDEVSFDAAMAAQGATVLQFDHTIPGPPLDHPNIRFYHKGWGPHDDETLLSLRTMMGLADWTNAQHPLLKFDTEGAEWASLLYTDSADLARFEIITGEFHGFQELINRDYFELVRAVFSKLELTHRAIHLHVNNAGGLIMVMGVPFPRLLELTWIRKDAAVFGGHSSEPIPGPLDYPNLPHMPDIVLRTF